MKVAILAGGRGTRLGLTDKPKPMVPVAGRPLLERLIEQSRDAGFRQIVLLTGHLAEVIEDHFGDGSAFGVHIEYARETVPLGTAGAVRDARHLLNEPFLLLYGDVLIDLDLAHMAEVHRTSGAAGTLLVHPNDHPFDSDLVEVDADGDVRHFHSKPHPEGALLPNLVNAALYALDPRAIDHVPVEGASDWGHDVFPAMLRAGERLHAYRSIEYAKDIGTPDRLAKGEADLASGKVARLSRRQPKPALFLDRDGVLNVERNGVHRPEDLKLIEQVGDAVRLANKFGLPVIGVTNQPDIAKGFMTERDLEQVHAALDTQLGAAGAWLDDMFFCPHHPEAGHPGEVAALKIDCECRKPKAGMLRAAAERHHLDLSRSWLIGDRYTDIAAAQAAGARGILIHTGHDGNDADRHPGVTPDHIVDSLDQGVRFVLEQIA